MIKGKRVFLREYRESDLDYLHSWISDEEIMEFLDWKTSSIAETQEILSRTLSENKKEHSSRKCFYYAIGLNDSKELIGNVGMEIDDEDRKLGELGWILFPSFRGHGYATEAAQLLMNHGFTKLGLNKIYAECAVDNSSSEEIMKRLGMNKVDSFKKFYKQKQIYREKVKYVLVK